MKRFENIYADLCVQAMVIEDKTGQRIVWMGMDFCKLEHEVIDHIKEQIQEHTQHPSSFGVHQRQPYPLGSSTHCQGSGSTRSF